MNEATQELGAGDIDARIEAALNPQDAQEPQEQPKDAAPEVEETEVQETEVKDETPEKEKEEKASDETEDAIEEFELDADELAGLLGVEGENVFVNDEGEIAFKTKVDGEVGQAKLADLVKSYQLESHITKKSMQLAEERKAFEAEAQQKQNALAERLATVDQITQSAEQQLMREFEGIDWAGLKENDPGRYAAMYTDFAAKNQQLQQMKANASQIVEQAQQEQFQAEQAQRQKLYQEQNELLLAANPTWIDASTRQAETKQIIDYAKTVGFEESEVMNVLDHRVIRVLQDAAKATQAATKAEVVKKKVKRVPKIMRAGAKTNKESVEKSAQAKRVARLKRTGSDADLEAVLADRISL
jgi:hypothetical protein